MSWTPHGNHLIAGEWIAGEDRFPSQPAQGPSHQFSTATPDLVDRAAQAAERAFQSYGYCTTERRAQFLDAIADEIEARADVITMIGAQETGLPPARLEGERGRTTGQLRMFADHIRKGDHLDRRVDPAQPDRKPAPRPEIRMIQRPVGPVAVFGASNFPLAFSTAGGDTAAALAAGCPVVLRGHSAHPGTAEIIAEAIHAAIRRLDLDAGVFSLLQGGGNDIGAALVQHPLIRAVGFTGSLAGGRALFDLCAQRAEPIPFFGELGSINPMFMLPNALASRAADLGQGWAGSLSMGAGQFCTNPGIAVVIEGADADDFAAATAGALSQVPPQVMLTDGIAAAYHAGKQRFDSRNALTPLLTKEAEGRMALPALYQVSGQEYLQDQALGDEVFGPLGLIVRVGSLEAMLDLARGLHGQLTATIHMDDADLLAAQSLLPILERKAGRVLVNGFPTGVEVVDAMVHGGPYPASTNFGATSVGSLSIRRFLRPVCYQNLPQALLPEALR